MTPVHKQPPPAPAPSRPLSPETVGTAKRKPWVRRGPVEVVLDQIRKQENRVAELEEQLTHEKRELQKLQKAKEVLEAK
jgi:hypothetical protein